MPAPASAAEVPIAALEPNPFQPRTAIDPARLAELTASIRESGIVQPILVRRRGERYQIIAGERRWRAAQAAGLATVPVTVREVAGRAPPRARPRREHPARGAERRRGGRRPSSACRASSRLTQEEIARRVGRDRTTIANTLRLLRLPRELRDLRRRGRARRRARRARSSRSTAPRTRWRSGARRRARGSPCARSSGGWRQLRAPAARRAGARKDANTRAAEERLRAALGARVEIARAGTQRHIRVLFKGEAELNRLYELLAAARARGR